MPSKNACRTIFGQVRKYLGATAVAIIGSMAFFADSHAATTVTVTADKPSGSYEAPITVTLSASDPAAKIWYVTDPNASPGDSLPYLKPIRIEKSSALLFFAIVDRNNESKVERRDYGIVPLTLELLQPNPIASDAKTVSVSMRNVGKYAVPLKWWTLRTSEQTKTLTAASVSAGGTTSFELAYSNGAVTLSSPDGEIRSTVQVTRTPPPPPHVASEPPTPAKPLSVTKPSPVIPVPKPLVPNSPEPSNTESGSVSATMSGTNPSTTQSDAKTSSGEATGNESGNSSTDTVSPSTGGTIATPSPIAVPDPEGTNSQSAGSVPETPDAVLSTTRDRIGIPTPLETDSLKISAMETSSGRTGKTVVFGILAIIFAGVVVRIAAIARNRRG